MGELALEPVGCRPGVSVGAGDQSVCPTDAQQAFAGDVHPRAPGSAGPGAGAGHGRDPQAELPCNTRHDLGGAVAAAIEHHDRLKAVPGDRLRGQRAQTRLDPGLLVPGGNHDDRF